MISGVEIGIILLLVGILVVVPRLRAGAAALVDEKALGREALAGLTAEHRVEPCTDPVVAEVLAAFQRLKLRMPQLRALTVHREGFNAGALADGTVILWSGLVEQVERGDLPRDELAGLLAHEVAHIVLGHGRQRVVQDLMTRPLLGRLSFLGGPLGRMVLGRGVELLRKGASRQSELEADETAVKLLRRAGFPPDSLRRFLARLERMAPLQPAWAELMSTHPHLAARQEALRALE